MTHRARPEGEQQTPSSTEEQAGDGHTRGIAQALLPRCDRGDNAPVASPCTSLSANSSIMMRSYSSIVSTEPMDACKCAHGAE